MVAGDTVRGHRPDRPGPRGEAERRGKGTTAQPQRSYYERSREVQNLAYAYRERHGTRPPSVAALYLSYLEEEGLLENEAAAREWAVFFAHFDIEPSSSLVLLRTEQDRAAAVQALFAAWQGRAKRKT